MLKISWDSGFKRAYKKKVKRDAPLKEEFWEVMDLFGREIYFSQSPQRSQRKSNNFLLPLRGRQ
jgi:mRNA-degrading endonuclease YafQ of YafQ-DinJ toxin-antitoxin module